MVTSVDSVQVKNRRVATAKTKCGAKVVRDRHADLYDEVTAWWVFVTCEPCKEAMSCRPVAS